MSLMNPSIPFDEFSNQNLSLSSSPRISKNVCEYLIKNLKIKNQKSYLPVCLPCYNENFDELWKTILSIIENFKYFINFNILNMKKLQSSKLADKLNKTELLIVPIFDGVNALSPSMKSWIEKYFPQLFATANDGSQDRRVRITSQKFLFQENEIVPFSSSSPNEVSTQMNHLQLEITLTPILKELNYRKHDSHKWFFDSICEGLKNYISYVFLTDCGTTYHPDCISRLIHELFIRNDLIGVTARQRVESPNRFFLPCEISTFVCLKGIHSPKNLSPCWKCYANYLLSPAPLQGFEFEATLVLNSAMFNLVEALPVLPGPCQLLNWRKLRKHKVIEEYFSLLIEEEPRIQNFPALPKSLKAMKSQFLNGRMVDIPYNISFHGSKSPNIDFSEFLRVNMRLAEDRILSFVTVFSTGSGTKWVPGATFYYQPEIQWQNLLTQRRRWMNGTFASFLFFFLSKRAKSRIQGAMFDKHKFGKSLFFLKLLWSLQLYQLILVLLTPAIFGASTYVSILSCSENYSLMFGWIKIPVISTKFRLAEIWIVFYFIAYSLWSFLAYYAPKGKIPENICIIFVLYCIICVFPIYFTLAYSIFNFGLDTITGIVISIIFFPIILSVSENWTSIVLFVVYLPWFLMFLIFFMVFIPAYSFSRLWDTTWGNRMTEKDSLLDDKMEQKMKTGNLLYITVNILINIILTWGLIVIFSLGKEAIAIFLSIIVFPLVFQMVCSFLFLCLVYPLRKSGYLFKTSNKPEEIGVVSFCEPNQISTDIELESARKDFYTLNIDPPSVQI